MSKEPQGNTFTFISPARTQWGEILLRHNSGSSALVSLYGGQLLECTLNGKEILFLSEKADFSAGSAIRGGIPVIFPWFGKREKNRSHGFARNLPWVLESSSGSSGITEASLSLKNSPETEKVFPAEFECTLNFQLSDYLTMHFIVRNRSASKPMEFQCALHTYLRCSAVQDIAVHGLGGCSYVDTTQEDRPVCVQSEDQLKIEGEVDRIYKEVPPAVTVEGLGDYKVKLSGTFPDRVIWNPGKTKASALSDLSAGAENRFVCVEAAAIDSIVLGPGGVYRAIERIAIV